jgi:cytochrome c-type biogenesis protein CcmH/NrfF
LHPACWSPPAGWTLLNMGSLPVVLLTAGALLWLAVVTKRAQNQRTT